MLRSKFRNRFFKKKTEESKSLYNKQRSICVKLLRKTKLNYYAQLDNKIVTDNRKFWKTVSPLFSEKAFRKKSFILKKHGKAINGNKKIAETFNNFFSNSVKNLNMDSDLSGITSQTNNADLVFRSVEKYANHPSILKIKRKMSDKGLGFLLNMLLDIKQRRKYKTYIAKQLVGRVTYLQS